jgi:insecticidal toxin complex protein TccC
MRNIKKASPEMAKVLGESIVIAKSSVKKVIENISNNTYSAELYGSYFGVFQSDSVSELKGHYQRILVALNRIEVKPEKIVVFRNDGGDYESTNAFVSHLDRRNKIYFNEKFLLRHSVAEVAQLIIHEASHQDKGKYAEDLYYITPSVRASDEEFSAEMVSYSKRMLSGNASTIDLPEASDEFISATGSKGRINAILKYNGDAALRSRMARNNADSLAGFAISSAVMDKLAKRCGH